MRFVQAKNGAVQVPFRFCFASVLTTALLAINCLVAAPASASTWYRVVNAFNPVHAYRQPTPLAHIVFAVSPGQLVQVACQDYGAITRGSNIWDLILNPDPNGLAAWVSDIYLSTPNFNAFTPQIPRCGAPIPPPPPGGPSSLIKLLAYSRAASQVGKTLQPDGVKPWACWCEHFVHFAYGSMGKNYATAYSNYLDVLHRGMIHLDHHPPGSALVFYAFTNSSGVQQGHVAFGFGSDTVITTPFNSACAAVGVVYQTGVDFMGHYLGWSYPPPEWYS